MGFRSIISGLSSIDLIKHFFSYIRPYRFYLVALTTKPYGGHGVTG